MITEAELRQAMEAQGYTQEEIEKIAAANYFESTREEWEQLLDLAPLPPLPKKDPPRPPRYAGPQNKGRSWTRQPPRLARSSCRKMRR